MREKPGQIWLSWFLTLFLFLSLVRPPPSFGCFFSQPEFIFSCRASVAVRSACVHVCVRVCVRACVRACVCGGSGYRIVTRSPWCVLCVYLILSVGVCVCVCVEGLDIG